LIYTFFFWLGYIYNLPHKRHLPTCALSIPLGLHYPVDYIGLCITIENNTGCYSNIFLKMLL